jgi:hypothetical protein
MNTIINESTPFKQKGEPSDDDIIRLAYEFWQERGSPDGSPEIDWQKAEETFRARNATAEGT